MVTSSWLEQINVVLRIVLQIDHENFTWNDRDEKIDTVESDVAEWFMEKGTWFITGK